MDWEKIDNWSSIRTVGDLKKLIKDLPDEERIYFYKNDTVYDLDGVVSEINCTEHSGKKWTAKGIILEIDG